MERVKLPVINVLDGANNTLQTIHKEIDLEARATPLGWLCDPETLSELDGECYRRGLGAVTISVTTWLGS